MGTDGFDDDEQTTSEKVEKLQAGLIGIATSNAGGMDIGTYRRLRHELLSNRSLGPKLPDFVRRYEDTNQFWQFIKVKFPSYQERRDFIWSGFRPALDFLVTQERTPGVEPITEALEEFDPDNVRAAWQKALDRRVADPEGAITAARMMLKLSASIFWTKQR